MAGLKLTSKQKLIGTIAISFSFFVAEMIVAFMTGSLALLADAFHYLNDLIGFVVALVAVIITENADSPQGFSYGWARASLLGAFFNGVFLLALGVSIFLQSIERFISLKKIEDPKLVLIMGCVGLALNILSAVLLHEHHGHHHHGDSGHHAHQSHRMAVPTSDNEAPIMSPHANHRHTLPSKLPSSSGHGHRDLGMLGALTHVLSDALNNVGVIVAALVVWLTHYNARFYADPAVSMGIAVMILLSSLPLVKNSGRILLESAPGGVDLGDVKHDLEKAYTSLLRASSAKLTSLKQLQIPGIDSVHELHIWRLDQSKAVASAHVLVDENATVTDFMERARTVNECLHAYGIHSTTLQPEIATAPATPASTTTTLVSSSPAPTIKSDEEQRQDQDKAVVCCQIVCGKFCEGLKCCAGQN
ncbi:cation diffusion facilitator family metal ion transporter [Apiospora saccharicola]|uniref:Cation diffusion facilitator family metal ion transporter n=1 Tax=Apiospora saccharicola TaxID=335842 RepID=A0ABR1UK33_9PEZI